MVNKWLLGRTCHHQPSMSPTSYRSLPTTGSLPIAIHSVLVAQTLLDSVWCLTRVILPAHERSVFGADRLLFWGKELMVGEVLHVDLGARRAWRAKLARIAWKKHCNRGKSTFSFRSFRDLVYILTLPIAMWPWRSHLTSLRSVFLYKTKGQYWVSSSYCNCLSDGNSPATQFSPGSSVGTSTSVGRRGAPCHCPGSNFMITGLGSIVPWTVPLGVYR